MKTFISTASVLACAFCLDAQIITTTLNGGQVWIKNNSSMDLVAFVVAMKRVERSPQNIGPLAANRPNIIYSDPLIETTEKSHSCRTRSAVFNL